MLKERIHEPESPTTISWCAYHEKAALSYLHLNSDVRVQTQERGQIRGCCIMLIHTQRHRESIHHMTFHPLQLHDNGSVGVMAVPHQ